MKKLVLAVLFVAVMSLCMGAGGEADVAKQIYESYKTGQMVKNPCSIMPDMTVDDAYKVQAELVDMLASDEGGVAGYKAGLTGEATQKRFGVTQPAYGVMTQKMMMLPGVEVASSDFRRLFIEVEIALILKKDITEPLASVDEAMAAVEAVAPAIELPDIRFTDMKTLKGEDIIADNVGAAAVIIGPKANLDNLADVNKVETKLLLDGDEVNNGKATDALGDQFNALMWLANAVVKNGGSLKQGQFVITGATGKMLPAKPGRYEAEYGDFGKIEFSVK